jgi:hypothetical protein
MGRLEMGRFGIGRLGDWEIGRLGDWEIGRLIVVSTPAASSPLYQWIRPAL